jgi:hypothetical protein
MLRRRNLQAATRIETMRLIPGPTVGMTDGSGGDAHHGAGADAPDECERSCAHAASATGAATFHGRRP